MKIIKIPSQLLAILLSIFLISSCSQIEKKGYSFELSDYKNLREKTDNKNEVLKLMGYPSVTEYFGEEEIWIYYSEDLEKFLFFKPEILDRKIMTISFYNDQTIKQIKNYELKDQNLLQFSQNYSPVLNKRSKSWWSQIFGNIGQVRPN